MSDFFKKFLVEDPRKTSFSAGNRQVSLAAFGKHPGWDDHVEDLGLETESLNLAKTIFYVNGIGGQIDSGAWEKLDADRQLPAFRHVFVWQRSGQILIGRLWSSSDGKGRKRYPMVVCAHFAGVTLGWALKQALPVLAELEEGCVNTNSAEDVRGLLNRKRAALREAIQSADARGEHAPVSPETLNRIMRPAGNAGQDGFLRVLYQAQGQLGAFAPGAFNTGRNPGAVRAQQIRVPAVGSGPEQALLFWTRFFLTQVDAGVPLLLTLPLDATWLDVTAGEPESQEFFCLRASPKAVPLVSEVPYNLDDAFRARAKSFLDSFERGETASVDLRPEPAAPAAGKATAPTKGGLMKWLGLGAVVIIAAVAGIMLSTKGSKESAKLTQTDTPPQSANPAPKPEVSGSTPAPPPPTKPDAGRATAPPGAQPDAARLAEEKKLSDAMAAAAKMKAEAEAAAAKEKERQAVETARIEREKAAAREKELAEQARTAAEADAAKKQAEAASQAKVEPATTPTAPASIPKPVAPAAGGSTLPSRERTNSIGMVLVSLPSGLWVGKYEVTQSDYLKVMGSNPSSKVGERQPVEKVSWDEAVEFCRKLTELERDQLTPGKAYALPTTNQWREILGGQKPKAAGDARSGFRPLNPVGESGPANELGVFDVLGNAWEWTLDEAAGGDRVLVGGPPDGSRTERTAPRTEQRQNYGFRCVIVSR